MSLGKRTNSIREDAASGCSLASWHTLCFWITVRYTRPTHECWSFVRVCVCAGRFFCFCFSVSIQTALTGDYNIVKSSLPNLPANHPLRSSHQPSSDLWQRVSCAPAIASAWQLPSRPPNWKWPRRVLPPLSYPPPPPPFLHRHSAKDLSWKASYRNRSEARRP